MSDTIACRWVCTFYSSSADEPCTIHVLYTHHDKELTPLYIVDVIRYVK